MSGDGVTFIENSAGVSAPDLARRFGGVARLYGQAALARFAASRVCIIGLGGVGTWAAEALARTGVGAFTLIDLDHVTESNTNRQIHALDPHYGMAKVQAMAERLVAIHPGVRVEAIEAFAAADNVAQLLAGAGLVIDCIDEVRAKAAIIAHARAHRIPVVTCGGAGGRKDPARIGRDDLSRTHGDPLLAKVRARLRREYGFAGPGKGTRPVRFGVDAIFSSEPTTLPDAVAGSPASSTMSATAVDAPGSPLACGGYGSAVTVTATMGMAAAACALERLQQP
jgi:tRNA A37 threonylcarbamoyladenosine dehydratase